MKEDVIYFDNNATTPLDERVFSAMVPYLTDIYGNSSSVHILGRKSKQAVDLARTQVGDFINSNPEDVYFTAGATEAVNIALRGVISANLKSSPHIITVSTEHPAVLETCEYLESNGVEVTYLPVDNLGQINLAELERSFKKSTILVSVMWANNETGVVMPIKEIADLAHSNGSLFMSDATQAIGREHIDVLEDEIDILTFSGHKFYGPKGIGAMYINPHLKLKPLVFGGGQERGLRSGTLNVPGIVGIGSAAALSEKLFIPDRERVGILTERLKQGLLSIDNVRINGDPNSKLYNTINMCFPGVDNDALLLNLPNICASSGSACQSMTMESSHVLRAMGISKGYANSSLRFSLGRFNNDMDVDIALTKITDVVSNLRKLVKNED